ncbi:MAG: ABC transporter substrate-binding protein [Gorillibacterium sp.]|nr:ABC transporter substrate-binding protein [Gorillibacterium sp.]
MKKQRKAWFMLLAVMLVVTMLGGCSGNKKANEASTAPTAKATEETKPSVEPVKKLDPYEIKWFFIGNENQPDLASVEKAASEYLTEKINATLDINILGWGDWDAKTNAMMATGEDFDVIFTAYWKGYNANSARKAYLSIDDYWDLMPNTKALLGEDFINGARINGKLMALPANKDKAHAYGILYRKDIAEKLSIDMSGVKSFQDLEPILAKVKAEMPDVYPFGNGLGLNHAGGMFEYLTGGATSTILYAQKPEDNKVYNLDETPELKANLLFARDWYKKGYYRPDLATYKGDDKADGKVFAYAEQLKPGKEAEMNNAFSDKAPEGAEYAQIYFTTPIISTTDTTGSMMAISQTSKDPERAAMFLELLNTDPYLNNLINFGIEGKHYKKVSDKVIEVIQDGGYTYAGLNWVIGNQYINYLLPNEDPMKWDKFKEFNDNAVPDRSLGFNFDPEPVKTELAGLTTIYTEFGDLYHGVIDPEVYLPKQIEKAKKAGVDKVVVEVQRQYDEWLKLK